MSQSALRTPVNGKVALVTGANRGIGKAIVQALIDKGASKVYLAVRNPESTQLLAQQYGSKVITLQADIGEDDSIRQLAEQTPDVDIVVNNAGILSVSSVLGDSTPAALQQELNVNLFGLLRMAQAFAPILVAKKSGAFVQLNSVASIKSFSDFATYSASKAAAYSLTQALRDQLAPSGIQVISVHPGPIATDMADQAGMSEGAASADVVGEAIVQGLENGAFHVFPDPTAQQFESAYQSYASAFIG